MIINRTLETADAAVAGKAEKKKKDERTDANKKNGEGNATTKRTPPLMMMMMTTMMMIIVKKKWYDADVARRQLHPMADIRRVSHYTQNGVQVPTRPHTPKKNKRKEKNNAVSLVLSDVPAYERRLPAAKRNDTNTSGPRSRNCLRRKKERGRNERRRRRRRNNYRLSSRSSLGAGA